MIRPSFHPTHPTDRGIRLALNRDRLKSARLDAGLTQEQLAHRIGITVGTMCKIERGTHRQACWRTIQALEDELAVNLDPTPIDTYDRVMFEANMARRDYVRGVDQ